MNAHNNSIQEFLGAPKTVFVVPVYQRNYDWKKDNCKQLFEDTITIVKTGRTHFLGTICFKVDNSHERSIVDGQQRLTSISLMLKAIYDYVPDEEIRSEINDYLYNKGRSTDSDFLRFKLHLNKRDDEVYHILLNNSKKSIENLLTITQKNSRVYQNYLYFYDMVDDYVQKGGNIESVLEALRSLTIIELEIQEENPQEIFESLNSTGLDLTNVDLLRNFFLMQFSHKQQTDLYNNYWSKIEDIIGTENMEQFFVDFLVFKKRSDAITINGRKSHINEGTLYFAFKEYYRELSMKDNFEKTSYCFEQLKTCAELYKNFIFDDNFNIKKESNIRKKLYFLLKIIDSKKACSLLLYIFDLHRIKSIDEKVLSEVIDSISSLTFRAKVCKGKGIDRQFAGNVMQRLELIDDLSQFTDLFWQAITAGKGTYAFPTDSEFTDKLIHEPLFSKLRSQGSRYLLYMLETHSKYPKGLPQFDDSSISIDHVMPQELTLEWKKYLTSETKENYGSLLHRLGNLALTPYNGEMSNRLLFDEKKEFYDNSNFFYTRNISKQYDKWQIEEIEDRSKKLAEESCKIWILPTQYQKKKAKLDSFHSLDEDASQFTFTKPASLQIGDKDYHIKNWSVLLITLCKFFAKENLDIFKEIANPNKISAFKYDKAEKNIKITGNVYVRQPMSTSDTLKAVQKIVKSYDKAGGSEYFSNITFSLKK